MAVNLPRRRTVNTAVRHFISSCRLQIAAEAESHCLKRGRVDDPSKLLSGFVRPRNECPLLATKRTSKWRSAMSAFGGRADIDQAYRNVGFRPKADIGGPAAFWASLRLFADSSRSVVLDLCAKSNSKPSSANYR